MSSELRSERSGDAGVSDMLNSFWSMMRPEKLVKESAALWTEAARISMGVSNLEPNPKDPRFKDPAWRENPYYHALFQWYQAVCNSIEGLVDHDNSEWEAVEREKLLAEILTTTISPTNKLFGNPEATKRFFETGGQSLMNGMQNMMHDALHNGGMPSQVDTSGFKVGENMAISPGQVVYRNEVLEILQYQPTTPQVHRRPVLLVTPQINKYYFLDIAPKRSFIEHSVAHGIQTFVVSWRNPGPDQRDWNFDTYIGAVRDAVEAICAITGSPDINGFGFCAGGITMSALAAHYANTGNPRFASLGFAVTLLDWSVPSMIGALRMPRLLEFVRARSQSTGIIAGKDLGSVFSWLRPNDLVWSSWINNYLMGRQPPAFDILAWNADSTNLPGALHVDFLNIFEHNPLVTPNAWRSLGAPVDLRRVTCDNFIVGAVNDHLTPWKGCYATTQMLGGRSTFVLSNAGHVASLINPPGNPKSQVWSGPEPTMDPDSWLKQATAQPGTWWTSWVNWTRERSGELIDAPQRLGNAQFPPLAAAPGVYVLRETG